MSEQADVTVTLISGVPCITTTEFKNRLGFNVSRDDLIRVGVQPVVSGPTAVYWRERDVFIAAMVLAKNLMHVAVMNSRKG